MKKSKFFALILSALLIAASISSCTSANKSDGKTDTISDAEQTAVTSAVTEDNGLDRVPDMNLNGYNFKIYSPTNDFYHGELTVESENGDVFNDARYKYIRKNEERFNIDISEVTDDGGVNPPRTSILAGDAAFDLINLYSATAIDYAIESLVYIIDDLPYVDLSRPYWNKTINDSLSICNTSYFASAPFNLSSYDFSHTLIFNKDMVSDFSLDNPYQIVKDGRWTYDEFTKMTLAVTGDLNGDGKFTKDDRYGFLAQPKAVLPGFWIAADEKSIDKNSDGELYFSAIGDENFTNIINRVFEITWDNGTWFRNESTQNHDPLLRDMFKNSQGLFFDTQVYYIEGLRDMETDFGIIPYPKYTETQEEYKTRVETIYLFTVPITNTDLNGTSAVIEALACEAATTVIPAYYEISIKGKFTRDDDSVAMLDAIFDNLTIDFGDTVWCGQIRDGVFRLMFLDNKRDLTSKLTSIETSVNTLLSNTMSAYKNLQK